MTDSLHIWTINGSTSSHSSNEKIIDHSAVATSGFFTLDVLSNLKNLPHFDPGRPASRPPQQIINLRNRIRHTDGILICTPEYVCSIPGGLKHIIEWCVAITIFSDKPTGIITASANGQQAHEALKMIMKTVTANFTDKTTLLIQGIKGKIDAKRRKKTRKQTITLAQFIQAIRALYLRKKIIIDTLV
jgi:chromate reductase, NAD(P)H dehydrogenase (quinone)